MKILTREINKGVKFCNCTKALERREVYFQACSILSDGTLWTLSPEYQNETEAKSYLDTNDLPAGVKIRRFGIL